MKELSLWVVDDDQVAVLFESLPCFNLCRLDVWLRDGNEEYGKVFTDKMQRGVFQNTSLLSLSYMIWDKDVRGYITYESMEENFEETLQRNMLLSKIPLPANPLDASVLSGYLAKMAGHELSASPLYSMLRTFYVPYLEARHHDKMDGPQQKRRRIQQVDLERDGV